MAIRLTEQQQRAPDSADALAPPIVDPRTINEGFLDWLLVCPEKGFFVPLEAESTETLIAGANLASRTSGRNSEPDRLRKG
jgi:hypothetical protein